jgi:hypothetical protein
MRVALRTLVFALAAGSAGAQDALTIAADVGLTIDGATPGTVHGAVCTFVTRTTNDAGGIPRGASRTVRVYGAPGQPYLLAISGPPGTCRYFQTGPYGIANALWLLHPFVFAGDVTSATAVPGLRARSASRPTSSTCRASCRPVCRC